MTSALLRCCCAAGILIWCAAASAEDSPPPPAGPEPSADELETFTVYGSTPRAILATESWSEMTSERVARSDARSAADVLRRAPGAMVQTNSRGETLVYLRNAGERQVAVFLDGAPLNVPWDYRVDLDLIPGLALEAVDVARGPLSNRYGPNVSGGALFLESAAPRARAVRRAASEGGTAGLYRLEAVATVANETIGGLVGVERTARDGQPLADGAQLPFSQLGELRTNTDSGRTSAMARVDGSIGDFELSMTGLYGRARLGVAPEGHLDSADGNTRYWRYPDSSIAMVIGSVAGDVNESLRLSATGWLQRFNQVIESFDDAAYSRVTDAQRDRNQSGGARARLEQTFGPHQLALSMLGSYSVHREAIDDSSQERFSQWSWSTGLDHSYSAGPFLSRIGVGLDGLDPRATAGRDAAERYLGWNASGGVRVELGDGLFARSALGSRARLPTPRELFGVALNRFVPNPELEAERNTTVELGVGMSEAGLSLEAIGFTRWTRDTIAQELVDVNGQQRRRRVNLGSSRVSGVELVARATLLDWLQVGGHAVASDVRGEAPDGEPTKLSERPELQGFAEVVFGLPAEGPELTLESFFRARAYSLAPEGFVELPNSVTANVRVAYRVTLGDSLDLLAYARVDNVLDTEVVPQLGLPDPGRWWRLGLQAEF